MSDARFRQSRIYLVGLRGSGKSSVGWLLAQRLNWQFVDCDQLLESRAGKTIAAMFAEDGEDAFRSLESSLLLELSTQPKTVIATGGGVVLSARNRNLLRETGHCIWLSATPEILWQRIQSDPVSVSRRPSLTRLPGFEELAEIAIRREPLYREVAGEPIDASSSPEHIVSAILSS